MLKSVVQAMPTYPMSCFKLPKTILHEINMIMASNWWGDKGSKKRIHWKKWEDICVPKSCG